MLDDSKGITLRSLGGIFLATLCGLLLSLVTLAYEMWQQKREEKKLVGPTSADSQQALDSSDQAKPISTLDKEVLGTAINVSRPGGTKTISVGKKKISVTNLGNFSPPPSAYYFEKD